MNEERYFLDEVERKIAQAILSDVKSFDEEDDFINGLYINGKYTYKQITNIYRLFHKYGKQIQNYQSLKSLMSCPPR